MEKTPEKLGRDYAGEGDVSTLIYIN